MKQSSSWPGGSDSSEAVSEGLLLLQAAGLLLYLKLCCVLSATNHEQIQVMIGCIWVTGGFTWMVPVVFKSIEIPSTPEVIATFVWFVRLDIFCVSDRNWERRAAWGRCCVETQLGAWSAVLVPSHLAHLMCFHTAYLWQVIRFIEEWLSMAA